MIGQAVRHGRTKRDAINLQAHLFKDASVKFEALNSVAPDFYEITNDMFLARNGTKAESAFLHISLSPARNMSDDELRQTAEIVMKHFNASDNQAALIIHEKDRAGGNGNRHAHLVLGRVSPSGEILSSGFEKIRLETAVRIAEFELNEPSILGRHHASTVKWLRNNGRDDVADYMVLAHSEKPEKPMSSASPSIRQKIERTTGKDLSSISADMRSAWEISDNGQSFASALREQNYAIHAGKKDGVFVVLYDGQEVGALDRLLKEKRALVKLKMGDFQNDTTKNNANSVSGNECDLQRKPGKPKGNRKIDTITEPFRSTRAASRRSNRADPASIGSLASGAETFDDNGGRLGQKSRRFEQKTSLIELDKIRLSSDTVCAVQTIKTHKIRKNISNFEFKNAFNLIENHRDGWDFIEFLKNDLMSKIKSVHEKYFKQPEPLKDNIKKKIPEKPADKNLKNHDEYSLPKFG